MVFIEKEQSQREAWYLELNAFRNTIHSNLLCVKNDQFVNILYNLVFLFVLQIKCEQYWPTDGAELYGDIEVTVTDWIEFANYTITTLQICKVSNSKF